MPPCCVQTLCGGATDDEMWRRPGVSLGSEETSCLCVIRPLTEATVCLHPSHSVCMCVSRPAGLNCVQCEEILELQSADTAADLINTSFLNYNEHFSK